MSPFPFQIIEERVKTSGRIKQVLDIPFDFKGNTDTRRGRGGNRGGRGDRGSRGFRGGRGRGRGGFGGGRGESDESGANFDLNSEEFPTLG